MIRMQTQEEKELRKVMDKAEEEGWIEPVYIKEGKHKGLYSHDKIKENAPEWVHKAWKRQIEIDRSFRLTDPPTEQDHQESVTKRRE